MVKFTVAGKNGKVLVGLGLSRANVERLQGGQPIIVRFGDLGLPGLGAVEIAIFAGEDEASIRRDLAELIGPKTVVVDDGRT